MKTTTPPLHTEITPAQFSEAMQRYADAGLRGLEINKAIEAEVQEIMDRYNEELSLVNTAKANAFEQMRLFCLANKQKLFARRRSYGTPYGIAGFRLGTPRLKTLAGTNWDTVINSLKEKLPGYVRTTHEPAKDLLLAHRDNEAVAPYLEELGIQVVQDDIFYVTTKKAA